MKTFGNGTQILLKTTEIFAIFKIFLSIWVKMRHVSIVQIHLSLQNSLLDSVFLSFWIFIHEVHRKFDIFA